MKLILVPRNFFCKLFFRIRIMIRILLQISIPELFILYLEHTHQIWFKSANSFTIYCSTNGKYRQTDEILFAYFKFLDIPNININQKGRILRMRWESKKKTHIRLLQQASVLYSVLRDPTTKSIMRIDSSIHCFASVTQGWMDRLEIVRARTVYVYTYVHSGTYSVRPGG